MPRGTLIMAFTNGNSAMLETLGDMAVIGVMDMSYTGRRNGV